MGAVAQLEERHNGIVEVVGSIPIGSTNSQIKDHELGTFEGISVSFFTFFSLVMLISCGEPTLEDEARSLLESKTQKMKLIFRNPQMDYNSSLQSPRKPNKRVSDLPRMERYLIKETLKMGNPKENGPLFIRMANPDGKETSKTD